MSNEVNNNETPVAESVAESVSESVAEPIAESVAEPIAESVAESVAETPVTESTLPLETVSWLYNQLVSFVSGDDELTTFTVVNITVRLMQLMESSNGLRGSQKKAIVLHVLDKFVSDNMEGENEQAMKLLISMTLPAMIDTLVSIDRQDLMIHAENIKKCVCPCLKN